MAGPVVDRIEFYFADVLYLQVTQEKQRAGEGNKETERRLQTQTVASELFSLFYTARNCHLTSCGPKSF
jgi:hypothetical protein